MTTPDDELLLARLRAVAARIDPVPADVLAAGRAAFALRRLDEELAELVADSLLDDDALAGVRGGEDVRLLSFAAGSVAVEVQAGPAGVLLGQVTGPVAGPVRVETAAGEVSAPVDELGRFRVQVAPGRLRLRLELAGGTRVSTSWVTV